MFKGLSRGPDLGWCPSVGGWHGEGSLRSGKAMFAEIRRKPVLGPHLAAIEAILAVDQEAPPKQRHTARRIFDRLPDEYGYTGCYSQVQTAVKNATAYSKEACVPCSHPPTEAQKLKAGTHSSSRGLGITPVDYCPRIGEGSLPSRHLGRLSC